MDNDNYVVKHNKLIEAKGKMTLMEQKILRSIISEISADDKDFCEYSISVTDFVTLIGASGRKDLYNELKDVSNRLMDRKIEIEDITLGKKRFLVTRYLSSAEYVQGEGHIVVSFDPKLKPYLLELKEQFTRYQLKYVMRMRSTHSLRIYELLKQYETIGKRYFDLPLLKQYLGIEGKYAAIKDLDKYVLAPTCDEINNQTDIIITYTKVKKGRTVVGVEYIITPKLSDNHKWQQLLNDNYDIDDIRRRCGLEDYKLSSKQVMALYDKAILKTQGSDIDPYEYIRYNVVHMSNKGSARSKYAYLMTSLDNDYARAAAQIRLGYDVIGAGPSPSQKE